MNTNNKKWIVPAAVVAAIIIIGGIIWIAVAKKDRTPDPAGDIVAEIPADSTTPEARRPRAAAPGTQPEVQPPVSTTPSLLPDADQPTLVSANNGRKYTNSETGYSFLYAPKAFLKEVKIGSFSAVIISQDALPSIDPLKLGSNLSTVARELNARTRAGTSDIQVVAFVSGDAQKSFDASVQTGIAIRSFSLGEFSCNEYSEVDQTNSTPFLTTRCLDGDKGFVFIHRENTPVLIDGPSVTFTK